MNDPFYQHPSVPPIGTPPEKKKLIIKKCIHGLILFAILTWPFWILIAESVNKDDPVRLKLLNDRCTIEAEYESLDMCYCRIDLTFNQPVKSGNATVAFYDSDGNWIEDHTIYISGSSDSKTVSGSCTVYGLVDSYEVLETDFSPYEKESDASLLVLINAVCIFFFLLPSMPLWIRNFTTSCREYTVGNHKLLVYAGNSHFYIKVGGVKYDEVVRFAFPFFSSPTELHTVLDTGESVTVTITPTFKRVRMKVNERLVFPDCATGSRRGGRSLWYIHVFSLLSHFVPILVPIVWIF